MPKKKSKLQKRRDNHNSPLWKNKADKEWKIAVHNKWGGKCAICKSDKYVQAHHLIPREMLSHRHIIDNGILLCAKHHKYSFELSAHKAPIAFTQWLINNHPDIWNWLLEQSPSKDHDSFKTIYETLSNKNRIIS